MFYFLTSLGCMIDIPLAFRNILLLRLRMPWRFPACAILTLPEPVKRKRFLHYF